VPDGNRRSATARNNAPCGQLMGRLDADACEMLDHACADFDQALADCRELGTGERIGLRDRGAHAMHQPERGGVKNEPHLIGRCAVTRHAKLGATAHQARGDLAGRSTIPAPI
jgi:hypothetical protein